MSAPVPPSVPPAEVPFASDPRPTPPKEPELEDCCGSGCVVCVFDAYQMRLEHYERALAAWQARHAV